MGKKSLKNVDKKKSYREKYKKEKMKKHKKYKKYNESSASSESFESDITSSSSSSYKSDDEKQLKKEKLFTIKNSNDESKWNEIFSERNTFSKIKINQNKTNKVVDHSDHTVRELNPYWKNGGNGLPPANNFKEIIDINNIHSLKQFLEKAKIKALNTGLPLEKIVQNEWGPLEKLKQLIDKMENEKSQEINYNEMKNTKETKYNFIRPGELCNVDFMKTYKKNWQKKELNCDEIPATAQTSKVEEDKISDIWITKTVLTPDELNVLAAKAIKAEIRGDVDLAEKLRKDIETAKKDWNKFSTAKEMKGEKNKEETVTLTKANFKITRPIDDQNYDSFGKSRKYLKVGTHKRNERFRYFTDQKQALTNMFERERLEAPRDTDKALYKCEKEKLRRDKDESDEEPLFDQIRRDECKRRENEEERIRKLSEARSKYKAFNNCRWCLDRNDMEKNLVICIGLKSYLCLPSYESLTDGHCLIVPLQHESCGTQVDEDVWNEMQLFRRLLYKMFEDDEKVVIFFETAKSFHRFPHMVLHCVPMDKKIGDMAPLYFKKAILESETEWSDNKKLIELAGKGLRRSIPKGLMYFSVNFGKEEGFAHVIEDEKLFPPTFAEEIIAGMMDLEPAKWSQPRKEGFDVQKEKLLKFIKKWRKFELSVDKEVIYPIKSIRTNFQE